MSVTRVLGLLLLLCCISCHKKNDIVGYWKPTSDYGLTTLIFKADGTMDSFGKADQQAFTGKYTLAENEIRINTAIGLPLNITMRWDDADTITFLKLNGEAPPTGELTLRRLTAAEAAEVEKDRPRTKVADGKDGGLVGGPDEGLPPADDEAGCARNMKQVGMGLMMYATDYDDTYPASYRWEDALVPYVKYRAIFNCPTVARQGNEHGYAFVDSLSNQSTPSIQQPASTVMVFETTNLAANAAGSVAEPIPSRHNHNNRVMADGHVEKS
jgi:hypothetical protein